MDRKLKDILHEAPAHILVLIPLLLFMGLLFLLLTLAPYDLLRKVLIILALMGITVFSRAIEAWQFGVEIHHFILFGLAYTFGVWWALAFVLLTSAVNILMVLFVRSHMFIHTMLGPMLQTLDMIFVAIAAGIYGAFYGSFGPDTVVVATVIITAGTIMEKILCYRLAGVDLGRLSTATVVATLVNYNELMYLGAGHIALLNSL
jgi:hypothetical protein